MKSKTKILSLSLAVVGILSLVALSANNVMDVFGEVGQTESCASIVFGTSADNSNGTSYYSSSDGAIGAYTIGGVTGSVTQKAASGNLTYPLKLGTEKGSGSFVISFSDSPIIKSACFYVGTLSATTSSTSLSLTSTSGVQTPAALTAKTQADLASIGAGDNRLLFTGLDSNNGSETSSFTIGNNGGTSNNNFYLYKIVFKLLSKKQSSSSSSSSSSALTGNYDPISFHFMELGNGYNGDAIYIRAGDNDILIDAGSRTGSASTLETYMEDSSRVGDYVSDNKLEYVIATHAHQDHIAGMVGNTSSQEEGGMDGILYHYKVGHLIDFSYYDDGSSTIVDNSLTSVSSGSQIYQNYVTARNYAISKGTSWKTAGQIWNSGSESDRTISLGNGLTMTLLYNFYYDHTSADSSSLNSSYTKGGFSAQNDDSVCLLFSQGDKDFLFTGDAEAYAEYSLVSSNSSLGAVDLFKAGHHGSGTANTATLLQTITPSTFVVSCVAGSTEYTSVSENTFPYQTVIDRIAPYTNEVYATTQGTSASSYSSLNGNIVVSYSSSGTKSIHGSASDAKLKDTTWFSSNRSCPASWQNA